MKSKEYDHKNGPFEVWIVWIVTRMDLLKYLFEKFALSKRLSRWLIPLAEFDL